MDYKKLGLSNGDVLRAEHIAHIENGVEAALKKQSDWNQRDATAPDFIKNRIAYPAYSPVLYAEKVYVNDYDWIALPDPVPGGTYTAPVEGRRYTFGIKDKIYSGIAVSGIFDVAGEMLPGIGIIDEQNGITSAIFVEMTDVQFWCFAFAEPVPTEESEAYVIVVEGDKPYNKLSVPDDVTFAAEGANVVFEFNNMHESSNRYIAEALINDVEFVVDLDGVESVLSAADLTILGDADTLQSMQGVMYYIKGTETVIAMIRDLLGIGKTISVILIDEQAVAGSGITVKSIKVNLPGVFAPNIPAKKLPVECMPEGFSEDIVWVGIDFETGKLEKTPAEINELVDSGKTVLSSLTGTAFQICISGMEVIGANVVGGIDVYGEFGNPGNNVTVSVAYFDAEGYLIDEKNGTIPITWQ